MLLGCIINDKTRWCHWVYNHERRKYNATMHHPLDASDAASLVQADWHEEYGDVVIAENIRETVLNPKSDSWMYERFRIHGTVGSDAANGLDVGSPGVHYGSVVGCVGADLHSKTVIPGPAGVGSEPAGRRQ